MVSEYLIVKESPVHGKGLYSNKDYTEGETITVIYGEHIDEDECVRRENEENNVYIFYKDENEYIDVANQPQLRYLNHSCEFNCDIDEDENGSLILYAVTDIKSGDELTIDYGYEEIYQYCSCMDCGNKTEKSN